MVKYFSYLAVRRRVLFIIATALITAGFAFHTALLVARSMETGHGPYTTTFEYYAFFSWVLVLVYLIAEIRYKIKDLGSFVIPIAFISLAYSFFLSRYASTAVPVGQFWLTIHRTLSFIGYATLALTFGAGIMYIIQESQLKSRHLGAFYYRLPSLEILDDINKNVVVTLLRMKIREKSSGTHFSLDEANALLDQLISKELLPKDCCDDMTKAWATQKIINTIVRVDELAIEHSINILAINRFIRSGQLTPDFIVSYNGNKQLLFFARPALTQILQTLLATASPSSL